MNATTGSTAAGWGSVLGVNSGGEAGFGVFDIPQPNTVRLLTIPGTARQLHRLNGEIQ
jgi:hypothetical protein